MTSYLILACIVWGSALLVLHSHFLYPLLLWIRYRNLPKRSYRVDFHPSVTLIISAYNEEECIGRKLRNALALDYPADRLEVLVVSDCSDDRTDEIVHSYAARGIRLLRLSKRMGKTLGLNRAVSQAKGEFLVFSDANTMYESDAITKLVRHFQNPRIGYVVGQARYTSGKSSSARSEGFYWRYETAIKKLESHANSVVGGDGAIYSIRRHLYWPLLRTDLNDFVNPLQIIRAGYVGVYDPEAAATEDAGASFDQEFHRKVRIVARGWNAVKRVREVVNPLRFGFFSFQIISHKILRWLTPIFLFFCFTSCLALALMGYHLYVVPLVLQLVVLLLAYAHVLLSRATRREWKVFYVAYYWLLVNWASFLGTIEFVLGRVPATWDPIRVSASPPGRNQARSRSSWFLKALLLFVAAAVTVPFWPGWFGFSTMGVRLFFYGTLAFILHSLILYPVSLLVLKPFRSGKDLKPAHGAIHWPTVTLLICAYNEADCIEEKILNSLQLDYPRESLRIVVASDGSDDSTNEIAGRYANQGVELLAYETRRGKTSLLNDTIPQLGPK